MREFAIAMTLGLSCALLATAGHARGPTLEAGRGVRIDANCNVESDYDFHLTERSVVFTREDAAPRTVLLRDGGLFVDGAWQTVSAADAGRIRDYERGAREAMPIAQRIGRDAAQIALTAIGEVAAGFSSDPAATRRKLEAARTQVDARIARSITANRFDGEALGEGIAGAIGDVLPTVLGDVVGGAVTAALSGDSARLQRLENMDAQIEALVAPKARALERNGEALCALLLRLDAIENAVQYRLPDGRPLGLLEVRQGDAAR